MAFEIILQNNKSAKNQIGKSITDIAKLSDCQLKDGCSLINPKILVRTSTEITLTKLRDCNYMTISNFGRKYFVNDITSIRNGLMEISGHVDVLETYKDEIDKNEAIIARQSSTAFGNTYLDDNLLATYQDTYVVSYNFPNGFSKDEENLILAVAGASQ